MEQDRFRHFGRARSPRKLVVTMVIEPLNGEAVYLDVPRPEWIANKKPQADAMRRAQLARDQKCVITTPLIDGGKQGTIWRISIVTKTQFTSSQKIVDSVPRNDCY